VGAKIKDYYKGDLIYIPQGCLLFDRSHIGYLRTQKPQVGVIVEERGSTNDRYTVFCMGAVYVTHGNQVHKVALRKDKENAS
jgi:hypothetical protein